MFYKTIGAGSWDFGDKPVQFIKRSSRGFIGSDKSALVKRAGNVFADKIANVKIHDDEIPLHVTAIGAYEWFGCFVAGTSVRMGDGSLKNIEDVSLGEYVVNRLGKPDRVITKSVQPYSGLSAELEVSGLLETIKCTASHKFYIIPKIQIECDIDRGQHCKPGTLQNNAICSTRNCARTTLKLDPIWVEAKDICPGDYVLVTSPDRGVGKSTWSWSIPLARIAGYFAAEGSYKKDELNGELKGLQFSFNENEVDTLGKDLVDNAIKLKEEYADLTVNGPYFGNDGSVSYSIRSQSLAVRLFKAIGQYSDQKRLGGELYKQDLEILEHFIATYFDGDGTAPSYVKENEYEEIRYSIHTVSRRLALDLQWILTKLNIPACVCPVVNYNPETHSDGYRVSFANQSGDFLKGKSIKYRPLEPSQYKQHSFSWNGYVCRPVRKVSLSEMNTTVFNLECENDHSYTVGNGVVVKNCNRNADAFKEAVCRDRHDTFVKHAKVYLNHRNKNPKISYGVVKASAYNEDMHRIELLLAINNSKKAAERNDGLYDESVCDRVLKDDCAVSMSTPVPYDVCEAPGCHHKAANRSEYCDENQCTQLGCKHNLGKVASDGFIQCVDNPIVDWNDISIVTRPADRIAYGGIADYMQKAASGFLGGAELAELYGLFGTATDADICQQLKVASVLAAEDKRLQGEWSREDIELSRAFTAENRSPLSFEGLGKVAADRLPTLLNVLANNKVAMSVSEFLNVMTGNEGLELAHVTSEVSAALPGVFGRLKSAEDFEEKLRHNPYLPGKDSGSLKWQTWANFQKSARALDFDFVRNRAIKAALYGDQPVARTKQASHISDEAEALAQQYALYKIAFLSSISVEEAQIPLTARLAVLQNYA